MRTEECSSPSTVFSVYKQLWRSLIFAFPFKHILKTIVKSLSLKTTLPKMSAGSWKIQRKLLLQVPSPISDLYFYHLPNKQRKISELCSTDFQTGENQHIRLHYSYFFPTILSSVTEKDSLTPTKPIWPRMLLLLLNCFSSSHFWHPLEPTSSLLL